jgi:hypothetical protein
MHSVTSSYSRSSTSTLRYSQGPWETFKHKVEQLVTDMELTSDMKSLDSSYRPSTARYRVVGMTVTQKLNRTLLQRLWGVFRIASGFIAGQSLTQPSTSSAFSDGVTSTWNAILLRSSSPASVAFKSPFQSPYLTTSRNRTHLKHHICCSTAYQATILPG